MRVEFTDRQITFTSLTKGDMGAIFKKIRQWRNLSECKENEISITAAVSDVLSSTVLLSVCAITFSGVYLNSKACDGHVFHAGAFDSITVTKRS